jgi:integrase
MGLKIEKRHKQAGWRLRDSGKYVPQAAWPYGLRPHMTIEEARAFIHSMNAAKAVARDEERRRGAISRFKARLRVESAFLPPDVVARFESRYLAGERAARSQSKLESCWQATQKLIRDVGIDPLDWADVPDRLWPPLIRKGYSTDWVGRIVRLLNRYGRTYAKLRGGTFEEVELPNGEALTKLRTAFFARLPRGKKSRPLSKEDVTKLRAKLTPEQYGWLWVCFWFGLRPEECDQIVPETKGKLWWIEDKTLVIYQPKLRAVMPADRLKRIPALLPEQEEALRLCESAKLYRPARRAVVRAFPEGTTLYGARHGFVLLQDTKNVDLRIISQWLGHRELSTTQKYYQQLGLLKLPKAG